MKSVVIAPYSEEWPLQFAEVQAELLQAFGSSPVVVEHIGSTAVSGLSAKPIVDVLLGSDSLHTIEQKVQVLKGLGYEYVAKHEIEIPMRRYFVRSASSSPRVHLHAVVLGSQLWMEHLAFRDALRSSPTLVSQYQELKELLAAKFKHDRPAYTEAKAPFIRAVIASVLTLLSN